MSSRLAANNTRLNTTSVNTNSRNGNENRPVGTRKTKIESHTDNESRIISVSRAQNRAPLGTIKNTNAQGLSKKSIKQKVTVSEASNVVKPSNGKLSIAPSKQSFTIYIDNEVQKENKTVAGVSKASAKASNNDSSELNIAENEPKVTTSGRQPLMTLSITRDNMKESPMILDLSINLDSSSKSAIPETTSICRIREDLLVPEYCDNIYEYLRELEIRCQPKANYMKKQPDITNGMRSILVDWLVEVTEEYKLQTGTLYLAVAYIDRFLSCMSVLRGKLQLVGTASMFIASKFEEIYPPEVDEFVYITDDTYTKKQVLRMEQIILRVLGFDLNVPTVYYFLQYFFHRGNLDEKTQHLALYLGELTLLEADPYLQFTPSLVAGSAICLAKHALDQHSWPKELKACTGYSIEDFKVCLHYLCKSLTNAKHYPQQAVREKYCSSKYSEVGSIMPPVLQPI